MKCTCIWASYNYRGLITLIGNRWDLLVYVRVPRTCTYIAGLNTAELHSMLSRSNCVTHNESLWASGHPTFTGVSVGSREDVPQLRDDSLLPEWEVVLWTQSKVANQTHQCLMGRRREGRREGSRQSARTERE